MALVKFYPVLKRSYADRERIASVYLPDNITDAALLTFATEYEKMTTLAQPDAVTVSGAKVWGITQSVFDIQAKLGRNETQDLAESPLGANGYLFLNESTTEGETCIRQQPLNIEGFNPLGTPPSGYPLSGDVSQNIAFFVKKWGKVIKRDSGELRGLDPDGFELSKLYKMH